ncbi:DMT family transporter [Negadavirga shengliensis]|uniref:DMT family transporter n=1 Tax=Negadavirga shengliensis TaxID=1389218 RepID=A0ABV9SXI3_9BACT
MDNKDLLRDYFWLNMVVLAWGFTAVLGLLISLDSVQIVIYRTLMAMIALLVIFSYKKIRFRLPLKDYLKVIGTGFLIGVHWILFFWAAQVSTASVTLAGMATISLWTAFIEPMANKGSIKWYEVCLGLVAILGLYIIFQVESGYWLGLSMAVVSACAGACFTVINGNFAKKHHPYVITFYEMAGAGLFSVLFLPFYVRYFASDSPSFVPQGWDWFWLLVLSQVCTVFAFSVSVELMKRLTAFAINLTVNLEPVYGILLAVMVFGEKEKMTSGFYWGTLIIVGSVCLYPFIHYVQRRKMTRHLRRLQ